MKARINTSIFYVNIELRRKYCTCIFTYTREWNKKNLKLIWACVVFEFRAILAGDRLMNKMRCRWDAPKCFIFYFSICLYSEWFSIPIDLCLKKMASEVLVCGSRIWFLRNMCTVSFTGMRTSTKFLGISPRIVIRFMSNWNWRKLHWFSRKNSKKIDFAILPFYHGKNKTYHLTMVYSEVVGLDWNQ